MLNNNKNVGLNGYEKDRFLPLIDYWKFKNNVVKIGQSDIEVYGLPAKERNKNSRIIVKNIRLYLVKRFSKVFIDPWSLLKFEYTIFNINSVVILHNIKT